jgi:hypothetical protein
MGYIQFQFRKGTASEWTTANPVLANAEIGVELDTGLFKIGSGSLNWNSLPYSSTYWSSLIGIPSGLVSSSGQVTLPNGIVSSSSQIDVRNTIGISTIATTGSNTFTGDQVISGSLTIRDNLLVLGSSSIILNPFLLAGM